MCIIRSYWDDTHTYGAHGILHPNLQQDLRLFVPADLSAPIPLRRSQLDNIPLTETGPLCSNGVPGIESFNGACCMAECGQCGGIGCSTVALDIGLGSAECCEGTIIENNKPCGEAPCVVGGTWRPST